MSSTEELNIGDERLVGADAIAAFRGEPVERIRYLIRRGLIPIYREGSRIVASRRVLREHHLQAAKGEAA
jgi:hypothetical protein